MAEKGNGPGLDGLAEEWIALWQEEIAALAADRDVAAVWRQALAGWGALREPSANPPGTPPAAAASRPDGNAPLDGDGGAALARLEARIAGLEQRLAEIEARGDGADRPKPRSRRPRA